jgi:phosphatidylglycerophosphatase A
MTASLVTGLAYYLCLARGGALFKSLLLGILFLAAIPVSLRAEKLIGQKDPTPVVIDEVTGQLVAVLTLPGQFLPVLGGVIFFRLFDTIKPFPAGQTARVPFVGIILDDVVAGIYATLAVHGFLILIRLVH